MCITTCIEHTLQLNNAWLCHLSRSSLPWEAVEQCLTVYPSPSTLRPALQRNTAGPWGSHHHWTQGWCEATSAGVCAWRVQNLAYSPSPYFCPYPTRILSVFYPFTGTNKHGFKLSLARAADPFNFSCATGIRLTPCLLACPAASVHGVSAAFASHTRTLKHLQAWLEMTRGHVWRRGRHKESQQHG